MLAEIYYEVDEFNKFYYLKNGIYIEYRLVN
jgi:hypothetical protein